MKRSKHSLSHYKLLPTNQGVLTPLTWVEVLPGDSIQHATSVLLRTQPLNTPVMHPCHVSIRHFFVPYRLLWNDWENFITGGPDGLNASTFPTITINNASEGSLADYLGVPTGVAQNVSVSALPFRAYAAIFNEWYRDQDLTTALTIDLTDGVDSTTNTTIQFCAWEKDYFTTARPWAQKGAEVTLPLGTSAPVKGIGKGTQDFPGTSQPVYESDGTNPTYAFSSQIQAAGGANNLFHVQGTAASSAYPNIYADLSNATAATINDLRLALAVQRYQEARARYGSRYTEYLRYLGVRSSDARLQRPEYLGGGKQTIQFSEVLQTGTNFDANTGVGDLKGHGIAATRSNRYRRFFEEHGLIMTLMSVKPRTMYFEGLARKFNRRTKEDFWQKELQHIGQQEILKKEIYMQGTSADAETWGYQDRYDEYRREENTIAGNFRSSLNTWHMARDFSALPTLNSDFVVSNPTNRIYQATNAAQLYVMAYHNMQARRLVAKEGTSHVF